jgi:hypothetical protein
MGIIVSYRVDTTLYFSPDTAHTLTLSTTEYTYKNDVLVHFQFGNNLNIRLNNLLRYEFKKSKEVHNEQFLYKKTYAGGNAKPTSQSTFDDKLSRFDLAQTAIEQEMVEEYAYTDKNGNSDSVQIAVRIKNGTDMTAAIEFNDMTQYECFAGPKWLTAYES